MATISTQASARDVVATTALARRRTLLDPASRSLAHLLERYSTRELAVIGDFLTRNAERLRREITRLATSATAQAPEGPPRRTDNKSPGRRRTRQG